MGSGPKPPRVWLRSFYGFNPQDDGYIGWTEEGPRDRMLALVEPGDLFLIYGAASSETSRSNRHRVLGFLQVDPKPIMDYEKSSPAGMKRKRDSGWSNKWTYAISVIAAWKADESVLLERIAPVTYRPEAGQAIAVWSPPLLDNEVELALKIKVRQVPVYGEPPPPVENQEPTALKIALSPSKAFPFSAGSRTTVNEDGPTRLYLARFEGCAPTLLGKPTFGHGKSALVKIGVTNDINRRLQELNIGFPPMVKRKWAMHLVSEPYAGHEIAETAESAFKINASKALESLGGEFFWGDWTTVQSVFSAIPGVSRFGK